MKNCIIYQNKKYCEEVVDAPQSDYGFLIGLFLIAFAVTYFATLIHFERRKFKEC